MIPEDVAATAKQLVHDWLPPRDVRQAAIDTVDLDELDASVAELLEKAILAERQRCQAVAMRWANDDLQSGEVRLVASYIDREIRRPPIITTTQ